MAFEGVHRVGHVGIWVSDIEKSLEWYRDVVGLKLTGIWGEPYRKHRMCFVRCEDWHHDIVFFEIDKEKDRGKLDQSDTGKRHTPGVHHILHLKCQSEKIGSMHLSIAKRAIYPLCQDLMFTVMRLNM